MTGSLEGKAYTFHPALRALETSAVYSFCQDGDGAIWINSSYGLCRFNGSRLDIKMQSFPNTQICADGKNHIYVPCSEGICRFTTGSDDVCFLAGVFHSDLCSVFVDGEQVWLASEGRIWRSEADGLVCCGAFPETGGRVVSLLKMEENLLVAHEDGVVYQMGPDRQSRKFFEAEDHLSALFAEEGTSRLWVGMKSRGVVVLDKTGKVLERYEKTESGLPISEARAFCQDGKGQIFIGTIDGLVIVSPDGHCRKNSEYIPDGYAIRSLMRDRDGNIWIGSFYMGVFLCESDNSPFKTLSAPGGEEIRLVKGLVEDRRGDVWVVTDRHGVLRFRNGAFERLPGTQLKKFQCVWYDAHKDRLWIGEYNGALHRYDMASGRWDTIPFADEKNSIYAVASGNDGTLFLGTATGVYHFDPCSEKNITRKLSGYSEMVNDLQVDGNNELWICGNGLWHWTFAEGMQNEPLLGKRFCFGIHCREDGKVWIATIGEGVALYDGQKVEFFDANTVGLADNNTYFAKPFRSSNLLVGTRTGLSFVDTATGLCYNYSPINGLGISSAREGVILFRKDGSLWVGGMDGIVTIKDTSFVFPTRRSVLVPDRITIAGESRYPASTIVLPKESHGFSLEMAEFDYSGITPSFCEYKLEGLDDGWVKKAAGAPISYNNVAPGKYTLRIRVTNNAHRTEWSEQAIPVMVLQPWYTSRIAVVCYFVFAFFLLGWLLYMLYARMLLSERLAIEKKENEERMRFFVNLSHELRTPLTMVIGQLGLFFRMNKSGVQGMSNIESSYKNAQKMERIVSELLDFEKRNQGYSSISVVETDLCAYLLEIRDWFSQYANYRDIRLKFSLPSYPVPAMIDRDQMQRVFSNILNNAFKFTPDGGEIAVALKIRKQDATHKEAVITFSDSGKGIPEDSLKRIFEPFYQDPETKSRGTGLGLALSLGIVNLHHGNISASNRKGGGAVFVIHLPLGKDWMTGDAKVFIAPEPPAEKMPVKEEAETGPAGEKTRYSMLIVEDDLEMRTMLTAIFSGSYNVTEASDGAEGFSLAKSMQPDIVISDVMMPVMDGMSLVAKLRQDFETCHIPIILLTAKMTLEDEISGLNQGADDYVGKPFRIDVLEAKCRSLLENRNIQRKKYIKTLANFEGLAKTEKDADFLSRATAVIDENILSSELGVALMCDKLNISRTILDQKIKGITGMTPRVFIETIKMKQACRLLEDRSGNISEIAYMLGFSSPKYFTIRFKKQFGKTPTEWLAGKE